MSGIHLMSREPKELPVSKVRLIECMVEDVFKDNSHVGQPCIITSTIIEIGSCSVINRKIERHLAVVGAQYLRDLYKRGVKSGLSTTSSLFEWMVFAVFAVSDVEGEDLLNSESRWAYEDHQCGG